MFQYMIKVTVTAVLVVTIAETAKRWPLGGAILASLPVTSILAMVWLFWDTGDVGKVSQLSYSIFWVLAPSFLFFLVLPFVLQLEVNFWVAMGISCVTMIGAYWGFVKILKVAGVL